MSNLDERDPVLILGSLRFRLAPRLQAAGVQLDWRVTGEVAPQPWLDAPNALHLLRIVQEALTNAVRHGRATRVQLMVEPLGQGVQVSLIDNGTGFDVQAASSGCGLNSMHRRAQMLGATLRIESPASGGVAVILSKPL
ncbi:sensor histidine kinase [Aquabacterium sp.]|uniref:sensor histidine kinase n=1 Tax=Aquabacterium sp. TaxID=1872578 RepID=UPI0035B0963F